MSTQTEAQRHRRIAQLLHNLGIEFMHFANELDGQNIGLTGDSLPPAAPFPAAPGAASAPPPPPGAPAAPAASGTRKRRTKAEIAADEAAVAAGFTDAADQLARTGGAAAAAGQAQGAAGLPPAPLAPAGAPVSSLPPPPPAVAPPPAPAAPSLRDNLQAALMAFGAAVESQWPNSGHGNGQMGVIVGKMGVPNLEALPEANVQAWLNWILDVTQKFRADPAQLAALLA